MKNNLMEMLSKVSVCLGLGVCLAMPAYASVVSVEGLTYSSTGCTYPAKKIGNFKIRYENQNLPWGVEVKVHFGFHDNYTGKDWMVSGVSEGVGEVELSPVGPFAWEARLPEMVTAYNGSYSYSDLQFYFEIRKLGESVSTYDNGGNPYLKYNVELQSSAPYSVCQAGPLVPLEVEIK